jgi:hypothetical protein
VANPALPKIGHLVATRFDDADQAYAAPLEAAAMQLGLPFQQA